MDHPYEDYYENYLEEQARLAWECAKKQEEIEGGIMETTKAFEAAVIERAPKIRRLEFVNEKPGYPELKLEEGKIIVRAFWNYTNQDFTKEAQILVPISEQLVIDWQVNTFAQVVLAEIAWVERAWDKQYANKEGFWAEEEELYV